MNHFEAIENLKFVPNQIEGKCFACGPAHPSGLKMKFYTDEENVYSKLQVPEIFCGWNKLAHGGIITTILDETIAWTVIYLRQKFMLTKKIQVDFLKPVYVDSEIFTEGKIIQKISEREYEVEANLYNSEFDLCAKSMGSIVLLSKEQLIKKEIIAESFLNSFSKQVFGV
jgi:acyl-coenzyme A thioesterase PaaI-like protein